jgi:hypothetical protein
MHALASQGVAKPAAAGLADRGSWGQIGQFRVKSWLRPRRAYGRAFASRPPGPEGPVDNPHHDDWTIDRWRLEPRVSALDPDDSSVVEHAPPLWKDLTLASVVALLLWVAAAAIFR